MGFKESQQLLAKALSLNSEIQFIFNEEKRLRNKSQDALVQAKSSKVMAELAKLDVEKLRDASDESIRIETLKKSGIQNLADIQNRSVSVLANINGISPDAARHIKSLTDRMAAAISQTISLGIDINNVGYSQINLLQSIKNLEDLQNEVRTLGSASQAFATNLSEQIAKALPYQSRLKWLFTPRVQKELAKSASAKIVEAINSEVAAKVDNASKAIRNKLSTPPSDTNVTVADFKARASSYYAIIEDVSGTDSGKTSKGRFDQELLDRIEAIELNIDLIKGNLRKYQSFGAKFAIAQQRVFLGDEMGLGKTIQALMILSQRANHGASRFLVICPASVLINWMREIEKFTDLPQIKIHGSDLKNQYQFWLEEGGIGITTFDSLKNMNLKVEEIRALSLDTVIVDEAHYVKNFETGRSKAIRPWIDAAPYVVFMSGTPMENRIEEFMNLSILLDAQNHERFDSVKLAAGPEVFKKEVAPIYLRRNTQEVLAELPELIEMTDYCNWDGVDFEKYLYAVQVGNFMAMRRAAYVPLPMAVPSKLERILEIVEESFESDKKVIVFSYFRDVLKIVQEHLGDKAIGPINGSVPPAKRQQIIDKFTESKDPLVLVSQVTAGGTGLNIQAASVVILCEPQIKPSLEHQAIARAHRMGQTNSVQVHRMVIDEGIDKRMRQMLDLKQAEFDKYVRDSDLADAVGDAKDRSEHSMAKLIILEERKRLNLDVNAPIETTDSGDE